MGDVYTTGKFYEKQSDTLRDYLIDDTIRMSHLIDPSLDSKELHHNLIMLYFESVDKLIEFHKEISHTLEKHLEGKILDNNTKGVTR